MIETYFNILKENVSTGTLIVVLLVVALLLGTWFARGIYEKVKKIDKLPCNVHQDKITENHHSLEKEVIEVKTSINYMQKTIDNFVQNFQKTIQSKKGRFTQAESPLSITKEGYEVIEKLGIDKMIENGWNDISCYIGKNLISKNPYDIQQFLIKELTVFPERFLKENDLDRIKLEAYKEGDALLSYTELIAIILRDRYFKENNINISDVDKYAPINNKQ